MFRAPNGAGLPSVATMLDDIQATDQDICRLLGVKPSTLKTYRRTGNAPKAVLLALFWETRWGRSAADTEAHNFGMVHMRNTKALESHIGRMAGVIWQLEKELDGVGTGAANSPVWRVG